MDCETPVTYGKESSWLYSEVYHLTRAIIADGKPTVLTAIEMSSLPSTEPFVICDFGTADGGTSMALIIECIEMVKRKYGDKQQLMIVYEDHMRNDFKSLINRVHGLSQEQGPSFQEFLQKRGPSASGVFVTFSATDFYRQCLPDGALDLGLCFSASHWLSKKPSKSFKDIFTPLMVGEDARMFAEQASRDWETFLLARSKELKPGGQLVVLGFAVDDQGQFTGSTKRVKLSVHETMASLWSGMAADGKITHAEFEATLSNAYFRTLDEYKAPFEDDSSPVYKSGLRMVSAETRVVLCTFGLKRQKGGSTDSKEYARAYVAAQRAWSHFMFRSGLNSRRPEEEKDAIVDEFFKRYEEAVVQRPTDHECDAVFACLHIRKHLNP